MAPIAVSSSTGLRIHEFLVRELGIPAGAKKVEIRYGVGELFEVSVTYDPRDNDAIKPNQERA